MMVGDGCIREWGMVSRARESSRRSTKEIASPRGVAGLKCHIESRILGFFWVMGLDVKKIRWYK